MSDNVTPNADCGAPSDAQRADHFQYLYEQASEGKCGASGMPLAVCKASICDCFNFPWVQPDKVAADAHFGISACWCGRDHSGKHLADAATTFGHLFLTLTGAVWAVDALDRLLRRWPWLYRRLGGHLAPPAISVTPPAETPQSIGDTCCGQCPGGTCYVDQVTGA